MIVHEQIDNIIMGLEDGSAPELFIEELKTWVEEVALPAIDTVIDFPTDEMVRAIDAAVNRGGAMVLTAAGIDLILETVRRVMQGEE